MSTSMKLDYFSRPHNEVMVMEEVKRPPSSFLAQFNDYSNYQDHRKIEIEDGDASCSSDDEDGMEDGISIGLLEKYTGSHNNNNPIQTSDPTITL